MKIRCIKTKCIIALLLIFTTSTAANGTIITFGVNLSKASFGPEELGVIVNDADPISVKIAEYYRAKRHIPKANMIHVRFKPSGSNMTRSEFRKANTAVGAITPRNVQAYALTWTKPYRVECMSITTAFAAGFDERFCSKTCGPTKQSPYFNSNSRRPYDEYQWRPTMMLAGRNFEEVKKLIDRGAMADHTFPNSTGYLVSTSDQARNIRAKQYPDIIEHLGGVLDLRLVKSNFIVNKKNVLFYFTGIMRVLGLDTIRFVPGAIADHLTSAGGDLMGNAQMSSLRWLEAGATGSYGTVVEPCNHMGKFPNPDIVINRYFQGETLVEAYWKSVAWPGEGIFIGEPLAAPFAPRLDTTYLQ
jgi:uncharacterized protein (TIGR03790 family)